MEYYIPNQSYSGSHELETRIIMDKDIEDFRLVLNPLFRKYLDGSEDQSWQVSVSMGIYYRRGKTIQPGIEYYDNFHEHTAAIFPSLDINVGGDLVWNLGAGFGLNHKSDKLIFKSILQLDIQALRPSRFMKKKYSQAASFN